MSASGFVKFMMAVASAAFFFAAILSSSESAHAQIIGEELPPTCSTGHCDEHRNCTWLGAACSDDSPCQESAKPECDENCRCNTIPMTQYCECRN